ncbi:MAG: ACP S-malonyltransferase [Bacilli bacterium]
MNKIAFVFSGQGSQYVGMGKELYENYDCAKTVFDKLDKNILNLCFNGPENSLSTTINTQPAILAHSIASCLVLQKFGIEAETTLGFSLGEYSALVISGAISFEDCLNLVEKRAVLMNDAVKDIDSTMYAVIGLNYDQVRDIISDDVEICNYNTKTQIVIGGARNKLKEVVKRFPSEAKLVELNVSGAFHSSVLDNASLEFKKVIDCYEFKEPATKVMSNYTGNYYGKIDKDILVKQMNNTVRFYENIKQLLDDGYNTFIEFGPGKVISSFIKTIGRELKVKPIVLNVEDIKSLNKTLEKLEVSDVKK